MTSDEHVTRGDVERETYTEEQVRDIAKRSFAIGLKVGRREATRYEETLAVGLSPEGTDGEGGAKISTRGHLTLVWSR